MDDVHPATAWEGHADEQPLAVALVHGDVVRTWSEFDLRASRIAGALSAAGLRRGDTVAIDLYNGPEFLESHFAALKLRCVPVHINYRYVDEELQYLLDDCGARAIIYHASLGPRLSRAAGRSSLRITIEVDDLGGVDPQPGAERYERLANEASPASRLQRPVTDEALSYTGGTTGLPKGVTGSIGSATRSLEGMNPLLVGVPDDLDRTSLGAAREWLRPRDALPVAVPASPLMHSTAMVCAALPALNLGGSVATLTSRRFDADELIDLVSRRGATSIAIVGDAIARPLLAALDARSSRVPQFGLPTLRTISSAGVAWSASAKAGILNHVPAAVLIDTCGCSEGAWYGYRASRVGDELTSDRFVAMPGLVIVDEHDREVAPGESGLIACPVGDQRYRNDPGRTEETFRELDGRRYVVPGDYGVLRADGTLTLIGRGTSTINTGGEKVHAEEVEQVIGEMPDIDDCLVVGLPDPRWGQQVVAVARPATGTVPDEAAVIRWVRGRAADYKAPKRVVFLDAVPRLPNGKPDRAAARVEAGRVIDGAGRDPSADA